ncbi:MAG: IS5/IS1182 family transposase, partial [Armatimonadetes bacterium]|nr:IS5/IS1182 family transposase [Armatimonadota bacterium]
PRRGEGIPCDPTTALRYQERTTTEWANARLKDEFGGLYLRVRGHLKAHAHIMLRVIALFADQLFKLPAW